MISRRQADFQEFMKKKREKPSYQVNVLWTWTSDGYLSLDMNTLELEHLAPNDDTEPIFKAAESIISKTAFDMGFQDGDETRYVRDIHGQPHARSIQENFVKNLMKENNVSSVSLGQPTRDEDSVQDRHWYATWMFVVISLP